MSGFLRLLVAERRLRGSIIALGVSIFLITLAVTGAIFAAQIERSFNANAEDALIPFSTLGQRFADTLARLRNEATATPCSPEFTTQLRRIAYRPDGFNEFLYAPHGIVRCSINTPSFTPPIALGTPDMITGTSTSVWVGRNLDFLGLNGLTGSIALADPFAIVLPSEIFDLHLPPWMSGQLVAVAPNGHEWHRGGDRGVYDRFRLAEIDRITAFFRTGLFYRQACAGGGVHCFVAEMSLGGILAHHIAPIAMILLFSAALAQSLAAFFDRLIRDYWSFEARFRRRLNAETIRCVYQPILDLQSGKIVACEVLARWRDVDGSIVMPDQFLPVVEKHRMTTRFTELVIDHAFLELNENIPSTRRLEVNFNIFPRDLDAAWIEGALALFRQAGSRFDIAIELVENDTLVPEAAKQHIDALRRAGIRTYIDDFGRAYANIQTLAEIPVEGVKLDRSFALAAEDSLLARLLGHAIEMIKSTGRSVVVEGIENGARMAFLKNAMVDRVQGYYISPPLEAPALAQFLQSYVPESERDLHAA